MLQPVTSRHPSSSRRRDWSRLWRAAVCGLTLVTLAAMGGCVDMAGQPLSLAPRAGVEAPPGGEGHAVEGLYESPESCRSCHPRQYTEWSGSMMGYGMKSPTFNAFEVLANDFTDGRFRKSGAEPNFCVRCHSPVADETDQFADYKSGEVNPPARDGLGPTARAGVSCVTCHQTTGPDHARSPLGDGIANAAIKLSPDKIRRGPIADPAEGADHRSEHNPYLRSPEFCGSCHDVRPKGEDLKTGEPVGRLENAFTEWERSPWNGDDNPYGRRMTCQDCHMSLYPYSPPGTYPVGTAASPPAGDPMPQRRVSTHYFTGADVALVAHPGQDTPGEDQWGMPRGQKQRRRDLLKAAVLVDLLDTPTSLPPGEQVLPVRVNIINVGAGHRIPTGFSQEREVWVELIVTDANGAVVYETGTLRDSAHPETGEDEPDGRLEDEDLRELIGRLDPVTFEVVGEAPGPDARDEDAKLGLVTFTNHFERNGHRVDVPFLADHYNNSRSLPPLQTVQVPYDVPVPASAVRPLHVAMRLRFRHFPPRFLRMLAQGRPDLVDEALVDRVEIIDMASTSRIVRE